MNINNETNNEMELGNWDDNFNWPEGVEAVKFNDEMRFSSMGHEVVAQSIRIEHRDGTMERQDKGTWYVDTGEPYDRLNPRPCITCGLRQTSEGHDPCIANLPGIRNACCGHGVTEGYLNFSDGRTVRGMFMSIDQLVDDEVQRVELRRSIDIHNEPSVASQPATAPTTAPDGRLEKSLDESSSHCRNPE